MVSHSQALDFLSFHEIYHGRCEFDNTTLYLDCPAKSPSTPHSFLYGCGEHVLDDVKEQNATRTCWRCSCSSLERRVGGMSCRMHILWSRIWFETPLPQQLMRDLAPHEQNFKSPEAQVALQAAGHHSTGHQREVQEGHCQVQEPSHKTLIPDKAKCFEHPIHFSLHSFTLVLLSKVPLGWSISLA